MPPAGTSARVETVTFVGDDEVFVSVTDADTGVEGSPERFSWLASARSPPGRLASVVPETERARRIAAPTSRSPAPCSSAGAETSRAELVRICMTSCGVGLAPACDAS